jgi:rod shape determining protein RodA
MDTKRIRFIDKTFIAAILVLIIFGLVVLVSATGAVTWDQSSLLIRQIIVIFMGIGAIVFLVRYDYLHIQRFSMIFYGITIILLLLLLVSSDDTRWLSLGPLPAIQVAEITKILLILSFASFLCARKDRLETLTQIIPCLAFMGLPILLIILQPDLGTAMVYFFITFVMLFFAGANPKILLAMILLGTCFIAVLFFLHVYYDLPLPLKPYQISRLTVFMDPYADGMGGRGDGWNLIQSLVAIGSGGLTGRGLFQGTQVQLNFLPEHHTDFIYAVIGEELGFIGAVAVIMVFTVILMRTIIISFEAKELYGALIVIGISAMWLFHVFENIGMCLGVMPITGIPLPFLSYGGSSMLTNLIAAGIILSVNIRGNQIVF